MGEMFSRALRTDLLNDAREMAGGTTRVFLGIAGSPGSGKSTFAADLVAALGESAALVEMDGFHLGNNILDERSARDRKGAPDTFDVAGFALLLSALRESPETTRYAPVFSRTVDSSLGSARQIPSSARLIVVEGNYLLHDGAGWESIAPLLDTVWFLDPPQDVRVERLIERHRSFGMSEQAARDWALGTDQKNAHLIEQARPRASRLISDPFEADASHTV